MEPVMGDEDFGRGAQPQPFEVRTARMDGHWVVAVQGEIDLATVGTLEAHLNDVTGPLVLDLGSVTFIDSTGLTLLLRATKNGLAVRDVSAQVSRLLAQTGFADELRYAV